MYIRTLLSVGVLSLIGLHTNAIGQDNSKILSRLRDAVAYNQNDIFYLEKKLETSGVLAGDINVDAGNFLAANRPGDVGSGVEAAIALVGKIQAERLQLEQDLDLVKENFVNTAPISDIKVGMIPCRTGPNGCRVNECDQVCRNAKYQRIGTLEEALYLGNLHLVKTCQFFGMFVEHHSGAGGNGSQYLRAKILTSRTVQDSGCGMSDLRLAQLGSPVKDGQAWVNGCVCGG